MKLGLGTVQFGLDYGISNTSGRTPLEEVQAILGMAQALGMQILDTAAAYGTSEEVLGQALRPDHAFSIVTKTPRIGKPVLSGEDVQGVIRSFHDSLHKLRAERVYGLLVHHCPDVLAKNGAGLMQALQDLKAKGLVEKIGVSVYTGLQIDQVLEQYEIDLIQVPLNVLDQRLLQGGHLQKLKARGVEIHVRSAFLQGLLLMEELPARFDSVRAHLAAYRSALLQQGMSPLQGALAFLDALPEVDHVIVGVNTGEQLREIGDAAQSPASVGLDFGRFAWYDEGILDPSRWKDLEVERK